MPPETEASIKRFGKRFNWDKIEAPGERWHFNYVGGFKRPNPGADPGNPVLRHGSGGFGQDRFVTKVQERRKVHGLAPGKVDGDFGDNTRDAVASLSRCKFARPRLPVALSLCGDHLLSGRPLGSLA